MGRDAHRQGALEKVKGNITPEAVRDAIEEISGLVGTAGTFTFSKVDHDGGLSAEDLVMVKVEGGTWKMVK